MNLVELKAIVDTWTDEDFVFKCQTFHNPHSYRGYYNELSFEYSGERRSVLSIKEDLNRAAPVFFCRLMSRGEFSYNESTPVHLSPKGCYEDEDGWHFEEIIKLMNREYFSVHGFYSEVCYNSHANL